VHRKKSPGDNNSNAASHRPDPDRLRSAMKLLPRFFDYMTALPTSSFANFSSIDWSKFILATIIAVRISFPIHDCPEWDSDHARAELAFDSYLSRLCEAPASESLAPASKPTEVVSASRVILRVAKAKYDARVASLPAAAPAQPSSRKAIGGCPMLDKRLEEYFPLWDEALRNAYSGNHGDAQMLDMGGTGLSLGEEMGVQPVYHDLWATMTMSWATPGEPEDMDI
jgi:hypothetical protein